MNFLPPAYAVFQGGGTRDFKSLKLRVAVFLGQMCPQTKVSPNKGTRLWNNVNNIIMNAFCIKFKDT